MLDFSVTFIITIINIAFLCFILRLILFKPVTKFMNERTKRVQDSIEQSEKDKIQARTLLAQYQAQLKAADTEAEAIIHTAKEQAQQEAEKIIAESRVSVEEVLAKARKQIEMEQYAALAVFRKEAAALVVAATERLMGREIKAEDNKQYADMLLQELSSSSEALHLNSTGD
jgi:F-type H+-transporting ATPase subunit b